MSPQKRSLDLLVLSDVHLGTHGSQAEALLHYLRGIQPGRVILNGDLIDIWQFRKSFFPASHMAVIQHILGWAKEGIPVDYVCGNHDEFMRRFVGFRIGGLSVVNHVVLEQDGKRVWVFHGDAFDASMKMKWLAKWGGRWYDRSIRLNKLLNRLLVRMGMRPIQISKSLKDGVKSIVKKKHNWEDIAANAAINAGYDTLVVGHIHKPEMREIATANGSVLYLNSGDWLENLTSLEYNEGRWELYRHETDAHGAGRFNPLAQVEALTDEHTFNRMLQEFGLGSTGQVAG